MAVITDNAQFLALLDVAAEMDEGIGVRQGKISRPKLPSICSDQILFIGVVDQYCVLPTTI